MPRKKEDNLTARWLWNWVAKERKRQKISRAEFARTLGIRRETLYRIEEGRTGSAAATLLEALDRLGALGAVAEIGGMDWHGAVLSLSKHEIRRYDAIAEDSELSRAGVIRQLAAEGLLARRTPSAASQRPGTERISFMEIGFWFNEPEDAIEMRSVSEGERLTFKIGRGNADLFNRLADILRSEGTRVPET
ncbi:MAG: helix-turn-helix transcriptional regulator [Rhodobacter sp.]|nr:helix-turn-helix transcriptional regulator [Rhodobacter sp.]